MLVPLPATSGPPLPNFVSTPKWFKMTPTTMVNHPIDWRVQTIENCRFISRTGAFVSVITTKEALGSFKAVVVRIQDGQRQPLFSESAATIPEALQALHARSAEAVQNHIDANGWDFVAVPKKHWTRKASDKDQGDSDAESSYSQSASSTVTLSDASDDDLVSVGGHPSHRSNESRGAKKKASKPSRKGKGRTGRSRSRSRSRSQSSSRFRSSRRNRSSSVGTVTSSSGDEDAQLSHRPPLFFRPIRTHASIVGWEPGAPANPNIMRGQQPPPPPPPPPPRPFPGMPPMVNTGQSLPIPPALNPLQRAALQNAANEQQRLQPGNQMKEAPGLARQVALPGASTWCSKRPNQIYTFTPLPARRPESTQSAGSDGSNANKPAPNTGYNPFTTVFSTPTPPQASTHDVLLHLRWRNHMDTSQICEERVLEQIPRLLVSDLKRAAVTYVQRQISDNSKDGANGKPPTAFGLNNSNRISWAISLKRVSVQDGVSCAISNTISDDASLLRLIHAIDKSPQTDKIPVVEVDVYDRARGPLDGVSTHSDDNNNNPSCCTNGQPPRVDAFNPPVPPPGWGGSAAINDKPPMNTRRKIDTNPTMNSQRPQPQQHQQQVRSATTRPDFTFIPPPPPQMPPQYQWYQHQQPSQASMRPPGAAAPPPVVTRPFMYGGSMMPNENGNMRPMPMVSMPGTGNGNGSSVPSGKPFPPGGQIGQDSPGFPAGIKTLSSSSSSSSSLRKNNSAGAGTNTPATSTGSGTCGHTHEAQNGGAKGIQFTEVEVVDVEEDGDVYFESDV